ncbi:MAG: ATPase, partial [Bdellovibrio sp.]
MISIKKELTVETTQENAFRVFSQQMNLWWPRSHHVGKTPMAKMVLEARQKGRWYSTHEGGQECEIGYLQVYEPNSRLVLVWQLNGEFKHDSSLHTEVEVNFIIQGPEKTLVKFEHRHVETLGKAVDGMNQG